MNSQYIAHIRKKDGDVQPLIDHLREVGSLTGDFAQKINTPDAGNVLGLLHDFGKFSQDFQTYIKSAIQQLFIDLTRVQINKRIKIGGWTCEETKQLALERFNEFGTCLVIVNTKQWAQDLYQACLDDVDKDAIFHLSTSLYPAHRKAKLDTIRNRLSHGLPVLCISTQLIEAGVDVSFGSVIRFLAGLDSIAQAAGRCKATCTRSGKRLSSKMVTTSWGNFPR